MKLRKISKNDVSHLCFQVQYDFDLRAFRLDDISSGLVLLLPWMMSSSDNDGLEHPPFGRYDLVREGYVFSHANFHRFVDGRIDVEYVYFADLLGQDDDNIVVPSVCHMLLEKQLQSVNFHGYYKVVLNFLRLIQRYE